MPISLKINVFERQSNLEGMAVVALLILTVNMIMKGIVYFIKRKGEKHADKKTV